MPLGAPLLSLLVYGGCPNAIDLDEVRSVFDDRAKRLIVGQAGALAAARSAIESWRRRDQRDCEDRVLHLTGPSGTGKTLLSEIIAGSLFNDTWSNEPFGFCGALKHKFEFRATTSSNSARRIQRDIDLLENKVANVLKTEPHAVIVLDDVGRAPQAMLDRLGELICPPGGSESMGRFRGEFEVREGEYVVEEVSARSALFILTSDFAMSRGDRQLDYRATDYHEMEQQVRAEFQHYRRRREADGVRLPSFWFHTSLVGFHPLTPEMLATLGELFVERTIASAKQRIDDYMRRRAYTFAWKDPSASAWSWTNYKLLTEYTFVGQVYCETRHVLKNWLVGAVERAEGLDTDEDLLLGLDAARESADADGGDSADADRGGGGGGGGRGLGGGMGAAGGGEEQQEGGWQLKQYERRHVSKFLNNLADEAAKFPTTRVPEEGVRWARRLEKGIDYPNLDLQWGSAGGAAAAGALLVAGPVAGAVAGAVAMAGAMDFSVPYVTYEARRDYCLVFRYRPHDGHDYPTLSLVEAPRVGGCAAVK